MTWAPCASGVPSGEAHWYGNGIAAAAEPICHAVHAARIPTASSGLDGQSRDWQCGMAHLQYNVPLSLSLSFSSCSPLRPSLFLSFSPCVGGSEWVDGVCVYICGRVGLSVCAWVCWAVLVAVHLCQCVHMVCMRGWLSAL